MRMRSVAIIGASGFTGAELLRICAQHPQLEVICANIDAKCPADPSTTPAQCIPE